MKIFSYKNKAYILALTSFLIFFTISMILIFQITLNSHLDYFKNGSNQYKEICEQNFLDTLIQEELANIKSYIDSNKISKFSEYFSLSLENKEIFFVENFKDRISIGGYRLNQDGEGIDILKKINTRLKENFKDTIVLNYEKFLYVDDQKFKINASIEYINALARDANKLKANKLKKIELRVYD